MYNAGLTEASSFMKNLECTLISLFAMLMATVTCLQAQETTLTPPENLVIEGVPPIHANLAETAGRYGSYRSASLLDWNPVNREMLVSTRFGDTPQLHLVRAPGAARQQLTFFADAVTTARFNPHDDDYVVFMKDVGGGEWYQLYRYEFATGKVRLMTDGKSRNLLGPFSSSGERLAYMSTKRTGKDTDLWVLNPDEARSPHLLTQLVGGGWQPMDWSPDDKQILLKEEISINESYLWLVDTATGKMTAVTPRDAPSKAAIGEARFSKDGRGIYLTTDRDSEFLRLGYLDLASKQTNFLSSGISWDIDQFDLSRDGKRLAFLSNEDGIGVLHVLDTAAAKEIPLPKLPSGVITGIRWNPDGQELGFVLTSARQPADCFSINVDTGKVERWTFSETEIKTDAFREAELIHWKTFDGKMISGFIYRPSAKFTGKRPVLVLMHGGPEGQSQPTFLGRYNYFLNELGIVLIYPNVRGSTGYGKTFSLLDNGFKRDDTYKDTNALFDWIASQPSLDLDRVAVTGGSYGGHMTLAVSTFYSDRIRCSIDIVGMSNLVTFLEHTEAYRRDLRRVEYGDERDPKMREYLERIAPMNNLAKIKKPMMVVAGQNDPRVPVTESAQIVQGLKEKGTPVWYLMAKDEGHGFRRKSNQDYLFYSSILFLEEYLLK
jgi:dipeptidyl aminopeptidase/acylaminoacyl peptidase